MLGQYEGALADCDRALELDSRFAIAYLTWAEVHLAMKNAAKAREDLESFKKLGGQPSAEILQKLDSLSTQP
jgi:tetratricopeptide (TPR) repeat protein